VQDGNLEVRDYARAALGACGPEANFERNAPNRCDPLAVCSLRSVAAPVWLTLLALVLLAACGPKAPPTDRAPAPPSSVPTTTATLKVSVREAGTQAPLAGADIWVTQGDTPTPLGPSASTFLLASGITNATGAVQLDDLPTGATLVVTTRMDGFAPTHWKASSGLTAGATPCILELSPAGAIVGTVQDQDLTPVPGAVVIARSGTTELPSVMTDEDGRFGIFGLPFDMPVAVHTIGDPGERSFETDGLRPTRETPTVTRDLVFASTGRLRLLVNDLNGVRIRRAWAVYGVLPERRARGSREGALFLDDILAGTVAVRVEAPGYVRSQLTLTAAAGELLDVNVTLEPGLSLSGVITDDLGRAVVEAEIELDRPDGPDYDHLSASTAAAAADEQGGFRVDGLRSGAHVVTAWAPDHDSVDMLVELPLEKPLSFLLPRRAHVTFALSVPESADAPEEVRVEIVQRRIASMLSLPDEIGSDLPWTTEPFQVEDVPTGPVTLRVYAPGFGVVRRDLDIASGDALDLGEIALERGFPVRARVVDGDGNVISNAMVQNQGASSVWRSVRPTGVDGTLEMHDLTPGPWTFRVAAEGFLAAELTVTIKRRMPPFDLRLQRGGALAVTLVDRADRPLPDRAVWVRPIGNSSTADTAFERVSTDPQGVAEMRLAAGRYELRALGGVTTVDVSEGGEHVARLRASRR